MDETRSCKVCHASKPLLEFQVRKSGKYLYRLHTCDLCQREKDRIRQQEYMAKNQERHTLKERLTKKVRYETDTEFRDKVKERVQNYYWSNREKILAQKKKRQRKMA